MIQWIYFPKSDEAPALAHKIVDVFKDKLLEIDSEVNNLKSDEVLAEV